MRTALSSLLALLTLLLAGCSALFEFNAFSSLEAVAAPSAADYEGLGGLDKLATDLQSPAIIAKLKADPDTVTEIAEYLKDSYLFNGVTTVDQQEAAVLYCDLYLKTSVGEEFVNNVALAAVGGTSYSSTIHDFLVATLPAEALASLDVFTTMVQALRFSNVQYLALGAGITDKNGNGQIDAGEGVASDINMGDVAQKAAVAYTMEVMYQQVYNDPGLAPQTEEEAIRQLYLIATAPDTAAVGNPAVDPFNSASTDAYVSANLPSVQKLFDCAGMSLPA
jgi:hypothetical protein